MSANKGFARRMILLAALLSLTAGCQSAQSAAETQTPAVMGTGTPATPVILPSATSSPDKSQFATSTATQELASVESIRLIGQPGNIEGSRGSYDDPKGAINLRADYHSSIEVLFVLSSPPVEPLVLRIFTGEINPPTSGEPVLELPVVLGEGHYHAVIRDEAVLAEAHPTLWFLELRQGDSRILFQHYFRVR